MKGRCAVSILGICIRFGAAFVVVIAGCDEEALWGDKGGGPGITTNPKTEKTVLFGVDSGSDSLYILDPSTGAATLIGPLHPNLQIYNTPVSMAVRKRDQAIFVWNNSNVESSGVLLSVDKCTGRAVPANLNTPPQGEMGAIAFVGDRLFGAGLDEGEYYLYEIDTSSGKRRQISEEPSFPNLAGLDADSSGTLYGISLLGGNGPPIGTIDIETGTFTVLSNLDRKVEYIGALVFDQNDRMLVSGVFTDSGPLLLEVDPDTGKILKSIRPQEMPQGMGYALECSR